MSNTQIPPNLLTVTATEIQQLYSSSALNAVSLVQSVLTLIEKHNKTGLNLRAMISVAPHADVLARARRLDEEFSQGKSRGPLHGIPFIVKDSIATHPDLGLDTTAGSFALVDSRPRQNATVVDRLLDAGMILIGKANLTEFNAYKGPGLTDGWSPVGGQTLSAYVAGGIRKGDRPMGHSGSSSGSAVGVSAGFAIVSLGVETDGSIVSPASRASLYAMKPTVGSVPMDGVVPIAKSLDSVGGMARSPQDLVLITEVITKPSGLPSTGYLKAMTSKWDDFLCEPNIEALNQMDEEYHAAMEMLHGYGVHIQYPVSIPRGEDVWLSLGKIMQHEFHLAMDEYLQGLEHSKVRSLEELVQWNRKHADLEIPPDFPSQSHLENSLNDKSTFTENQQTLRELRELAGPDKVLDQHNLDAIGILTDSPLSSLASAAGYPICTMPLGILKLNGRPFGMSFVAKACQEAKLFQIMSAWHQSFSRQAPPALEEDARLPDLA